MPAVNVLDLGYLDSIVNELRLTAGHCIASTAVTLTHAEFTA